MTDSEETGTHFWNSLLMTHSKQNFSNSMQGIKTAKLKGARTIDKTKIQRVIRMLYMSFSFWLLRVELRDFSQAKKERDV